MIIRLYKKKTAIAFLAFVFLIAACLAVVGLAGSGRSVSLSKAYSIAYREVCKWADDPALCLITSVDEPDSTPDDGKDGERRYWNMIFADPNSSDREFIVSIHDRAAEVVPIQQEIDRTQFIDMDDLVLTSKRAVSSAIKDYGLLPGQDWARGYHFVLRSFDGKLDFQVVGLGDDHNMRRIAFDGSTGEYIKTLVPGDG